MATEIITPEELVATGIKVEPGVYNIKHDDTEETALKLTTTDQAAVEKDAETEKKPEYRGVTVKVKDATDILVGGHQYQLVYDYRDGFDPERLGQRYENILAKYDYIVGDWGFEQLRLRGFYNERNHSANRDQIITTLQDYINEFCNFGCAFFVLEKHVTASSPHRVSNNRRRKHTSSNAKQGESKSVTQPSGTKKQSVAKNKTQASTRQNHNTKQKPNSQNKRTQNNRDPEHTQNNHQGKKGQTQNQRTKASRTTKNGNQSVKSAERGTTSSYTVRMLKNDSKKENSPQSTKPRAQRKSAPNKSTKTTTTNTTATKPNQHNHEFHIRQLTD